MKIVFLVIFLASCSQSSNPIGQTIDRSSVLDKIKNGTLVNIVKEPLFPQIIDSPDFILNQYITREKAMYPKFDIDLMFSNLILTDDSRYIIHIDLQKQSPNFRNCILISTSFDNANQEYLCKKEAAECLIGKSVSDINGYNRCYQSETCKKVKSNKVEKIDKIYCEKLYGRKL
jgi:hypothetical protein